MHTQRGDLDGNRNKKLDPILRQILKSHPDLMGLKSWCPQGSAAFWVR